MVFTSFLDRENLSLIEWYQTIRSMFLFQVYLLKKLMHELLDDVDSDDEDENDNLMNDSATELVDGTAIENLQSDISETVIYKKDDSNISNFIPTTKPIAAVARIANKILNL